MCVCVCVVVVVIVVVLVCEYVLVFTPSVCVRAGICASFVFKKKKEEKFCNCVFFSPLHAQKHLTQQQMAVCHQSVDSSRIFPWKESQRRETRVQMAVYSATSHPQGVMKEGLFYSRTPSQCLQSKSRVQRRSSKSC